MLSYNTRKEHLKLGALLNAELLGRETRKERTKSRSALHKETRKERSGAVGAAGALLRERTKSALEL